MQEQSFIQPLTLASPQVLEFIDSQLEGRRINFTMACDQNKLPCPSCQAHDQPVYNNESKSWRHFEFFQYGACIHTRDPHNTVESYRATPSPAWESSLTQRAGLQKSIYSMRHTN